jgi:L-2-hydroxyglutarate oxidase LhgO
MEHDFEAIVIGAGAVGLACAAALGRMLGPTLVLEETAEIGSGISSRNSEVVHGGLYYPTGSLKHRLCVEGRRLLYSYLERAGLPFLKCGKLVVATDAGELDGIETLARQAFANGVENIRLLDRSDVARLEPDVAAEGALFSPETGVFDSHAFMLALSAEIEGTGGHIALRTPFLGAEPGKQGFRVRTGGPDPVEVKSRFLVNSAGLTASAVAAAIAGYPADAIPDLRFARGCYFGLSGVSPFRHLVYPAPVDGGLGVHATLDLAGRVRFGPDVEWLAPETNATDLGYDVSPTRAGAFYSAIRRYWPGLPDGALYPDYAGIRPKLNGPGESAADFRVDTEAVHGLAGLVSLFGVESPGLTASLAIGDMVASALVQP